MSLIRHCLVAAALALTCSVAQAAAVFPVKAYTKPDEAIVVRFVNEKGDEGKKAIEALGADAGKLESLFTPAAAAEVTGAYKIYNAAGEEQKLAADKVNADGTVDLSAALPKLKEGGTFYLVWKDAAPLVINTLYNPGRGPRELAALKARIEQLPADRQKEIMRSFSPAVTHMETAVYAEITTDKGVIKAKFAYSDAPHTVDNFISLARQGFYDGSTFHRVMKDFMIQGGDAYGNDADKAGTGGPGYSIIDEFSDKKHNKGVLSMANSNGQDRKDTSAQFFIMHANKTYLDGSYNAFGDVFEGINIVDDIATTTKVDTSAEGNGKVTGPRPKIISIKIKPATAEIYGVKK